MAVYKSDIADITFNLFDQLQTDQKSGMAKEDILQILSEYDKFVANEVFPSRIEGDKVGVKLEKDGVKVPACFRKAKEGYYANGWFGLGLSEDIGGMPVPHALKTAASSLSIGANVAFEMYPGLSRAAVNVIDTIGSAEQKERFLPKMMDGTWGGTMCLTEPGAGSDVGASISTALPKGDGKFAIKGIKIFISSGESDLYQNNIHLVLARTPGSPEGVKGLSLFIVPRFELDSGKPNNVLCTKIEEKMGIHGSATCEMSFGKDGECLGELIGKEHEGISNMFLMMNEARLMCGIQGEAQANLAYELTLQYAKERVQFGKEIVHLPDVKRMLLSMRSTSRAMRSLLLYTAGLFDLEGQGDNSAQQEIALLTPICKGWCTEEGFKVCVDAVQVHGGYGYCTEYGIEQFVRDTKIATIYEGTTGIQAIDLLMRKVLKDQGKTLMSLVQKIAASLQSPHAQQWVDELAIFKDTLADGEKMLKKFSKQAQAQEFDQILEHANKFLTYMGNLVAGWRLLDGAIIANQKISQSSGDEKRFLQSKIDDLRFYARHKLLDNKSIALTILSDNFSACALEL